MLKSDRHCSYDRWSRRRYPEGLLAEPFGIGLEALTLGSALARLGLGRQSNPARRYRPPKFYILLRLRWIMEQEWVIR